ncbi:hypothetical protein K438DRAFT_1718835 [Mycena galopus ATCC 62051]|nr:hypothetical protein K438DRAFT_1718835 [Mycena galopus ATCC 62051]
MQVTITRLPTAVSIVSIPRSRLDALSHPVLHALLQPNPPFLSITCNALELSLFAEPDCLYPFDAIARADEAARSNSAEAPEPVEISHDRWSVLQIDSHSDQLDNAGARVNELSAPLAAAGISILYQSSYMSDFIFVKERRLAEAMALFAAAGFTLYAADPNLLTALLESPPAPSLTRERSGSAPLPSSAVSRSTSKSSRKGNSCASSTKAHEKSFSTPAPAATTPSKPKSKSPSNVPLRDVSTLAPDLACVGLADDAADHWALKIVKLVAFPDLIPLPATRVPSLSATYRRTTSPVEEHNEDDGYFSSPSMEEPDPDTGPAGDEKDENAEDEHAKDEHAKDEHAKDEHAKGVLPSPARPVPSRLDVLPAWLATSDSPEWQKGSDKPQTINGDETQSPRRLTQAQAPAEHTIPFFSFTRTPEGSSLTTGARVLAALFPRSERHMVICSTELDAADREAEAAAMHPHSPSASSSFSSMSEDADGSSEYDSEEDEDMAAADPDAHPLLTALQVDLRGAGLDTYGLVHRFSRALAKGGVNHMYASTLRSANLLVPTGPRGRGARRANELLRDC